MRAQERRDDVDGAPLAKRTRRPQLLLLLFEREAVSRFDLHGRSPFRDQRVETRQRLLDQIEFAGLARGLHGRRDAAAGARDVFVACPVEPEFEFARAVAAVNQMSVAIDQAGRDPASVAIGAPHGIKSGRLVLRSRIDDPSRLGRDDAILDEAHPARKRREAGVIPDGVNAHHNSGLAQA